MLNYTVRLIPKEQTHSWLLKKHYARRIPSISYAYGLFDENMILQGVCTYGSPPSHALVIGILGGEYIDDILELNRLCINEGLDSNCLSYFVSHTLKLLPKIKVIVSYADTSQGHIGYIYQACNFIYTGLSAERTEWYVKGLEKLHSKSLSDGETKETLVAKYGDKLAYRDRPRKHRYIYIVANKREYKTILAKLKYPIIPYPKGDNKRYDASFAPPHSERINMKALDRSALCNLAENFKGSFPRMTTATSQTVLSTISVNLVFLYGADTARRLTYGA